METGTLLTKAQTIKELKRLKWKCVKGLWSTEKRGLKTHTKYGVTLREAASLEWIFTENL